MAVWRSPDPVAVQQAASCSFLLGALVAFPGVMAPLWSLQFNLGSQGNARLFLFLALGVVTGAVGARRLAAEGRLRTLAGLSSVVASVSMLSIATAYVPERVWWASLGLGLSIGMLTLAQSTLLFEPVAASPHSLALCEFFFGSGAVALIVVVSALVDAVALASMTLLLAALPLLFALQLLRAKPRLRNALPREDVAFGWKALWRPAILLLILVVLLQGAVHGAAACWLATYLARTFGTSFQLSLIMLGLYWFSLTASCLAATRLPPLEDRSRWLVWVTLGIVIGCAFLLETTTLSGAVAGTAVLGLATGTLQALTAGWVRRNAGWRHLVWFRSLSVIFVVSMAGVGCAVGYLIPFGGAVSIVWSILGAGLLLSVSLGVLLIEARLLEKRSAVR